MKLTWKLFYCLFGKHERGSWKDVVGDRRILVCVNCDKIMNDVTDYLQEKKGSVENKSPMGGRHWPDNIPNPRSMPKE